MNILLTADWHLTDNPLDEYRWKVLDLLPKIVTDNQVGVVYVLGDLTDRKDRHTGNLVNRLIDGFKRFRAHTGAGVIIISGNHDAPTTGEYYWQFLNEAGIHYITKPQVDIHGILLLPFSYKPIEEWKQINLAQHPAIFMHQTVLGSVAANGRKIEKITYPLPPLPKHNTIYSGDVHCPQKVDNVIYIGAVHPVHFDETWENRMLLVDTNDFKNYREIPILTVRRAILDIKSADELFISGYGSGDQLRIRYQLTGNGLTKWPEEQQRIRNWANERGVFIASLESTLVGNTLKTEDAKKIEIMKPSEVIQTFCKEESLSDDIMNMGLELVKE